MKLDVFSKFTPFDFVSKSDDDGKTYKIEGIASSEAVDESGEIIKQDGLDWSYCLKTGAFNLDHKNDPKYILGAPTETYITDVGGVKATGIKGVLYGQKQIVQDVFETAKAMKSSGVRKMGFSIEGRVLARDPRNPKIITKAKVLNVSITGNPCNQQATIEMIKNIYKNATPEQIELLEKDNTMEKDAYSDLSMSYKQSKILEDYSSKMCDLLGKLPEDADLPEWVQSKLTKALDYLQASYHYLEVEMKEKELVDKFLQDKPLPEVKEGDDEGATQTEEAPGQHPTHEEDDDYTTNDKPYGVPVRKEGTEVGYQQPAQADGSVSALAVESLEDKMSSQDYSLSDKDLKQLVISILRDYPQLTDEKVMALIHDVMERKSYHYKKK